MQPSRPPICFVILAERRVRRRVPRPPHGYWHRQHRAKHHLASVRSHRLDAVGEHARTIERDRCTHKPNLPLGDVPLNVCRIARPPRNQGFRQQQDFRLFVPIGYCNPTMQTLDILEQRRRAGSDIEMYALDAARQGRTVNNHRREIERQRHEDQRHPTPPFPPRFCYGRDPHQQQNYAENARPRKKDTRRREGRHPVEKGQGRNQRVEQQHQDRFPRAVGKRPTRRQQRGTAKPKQNTLAQMPGTEKDRRRLRDARRTGQVIRQRNGVARPAGLLPDNERDEQNRQDRPQIPNPPDKTAGCRRDDEQQHQTAITTPQSRHTERFHEKALGAVRGPADGIARAANKTENLRTPAVSRRKNRLARTSCRGNLWGLR
ncbi:hypothetical protein F0726_01735 [Acidithiobacillus caldus]|nr:hypothetical protein F0726_01735 [Acidithiobacillus caldus]